MLAACPCKMCCHRGQELGRPSNKSAFAPQACLFTSSVHQLCAAAILDPCGQFLFLPSGSQALQSCSYDDHPHQYWLPFLVEDSVESHKPSRLGPQSNSQTSLLFPTTGKLSHTILFQSSLRSTYTGLTPLTLRSHFPSTRRNDNQPTEEGCNFFH